MSILPINQTLCGDPKTLHGLRTVTCLNDDFVKLIENGIILEEVIYHRKKVYIEINIGKHKYSAIYNTYDDSYYEEEERVQGIGWRRLWWIKRPGQISYTPKFVDYGSNLPVYMQPKELVDLLRKRQQILEEKNKILM